MARQITHSIFCDEHIKEEDREVRIITRWELTKHTDWSTQVIINIFNSGQGSTSNIALNVKVDSPRTIEQIFEDVWEQLRKIDKTIFHTRSNWNVNIGLDDGKKRTYTTCIEVEHPSQLTNELVEATLIQFRKSFDSLVWVGNQQ